ncbi:MAG TPA: Ig-like domain-containing protein, partial [Elainellaceae cyanobacterium]
VTDVTDGANGTVIINPDGTVKYTPNADFNGTDSFTYTVTSGGVEETATVTVTVNPVNDSPVLDLDGNDSSGTLGSNYLTGFIEGGNLVAIADRDAAIIDVDDTTIESAIITLTNRPDGLIEGLSVSGMLPAGIIASTYNSSTGQITLTGSASLADYQSAIAQIVYNNTSTNPNTANRIVTVIVNDGELDSNIVTTTLSITKTNDPPSLDLDGNNSSGRLGNDYQTLFTPGRTTAIADVDPKITDIDDVNIDSATVTLVNRPNGNSEKLLVNGTLPSGITAGAYDSLTGRLVLTGSTSLANYQAAIASIAYSNTASIKDRSDRTVQVIINDGEDSSNIASTTIRFDTDGDGVADIDDLDDDNDGIPDALEENGNPNRDTDGDGVLDSLDLDSDNDGIFDVRESGLSSRAIATLDANNDGAIDLVNPVGTNGLANAVESAPDSGILNYTIADTDGDGVRDFQDLDSDNDGIPDVVEAGGSDPEQDAIIGSGNIVDRNGNGVADSIDPTLGGTPLSVPDGEGDGIPDYRDLDSDNDGIFDLREKGGNLPDVNNDGRVDGPDSDGDGLVDAIDSNDNAFGSKTAPISNPQDSDGDGIPDFQELPNPNNNGSQGSDTVSGTNGDDILNGFSDIDFLRGFGGNDLINGGSSGDTLIGDDGNDTLNGGSGNDRMDGGIDNDALNGGSGNDRMWGRDGDDILEGGRGNDRMWGGNGNDILNGSEGRDRLYGEAGKDIIRGSRGNDFIVGGFGKDELTGGQGRDKFVYQSVKDFKDIITDFEIIKDRIDLRRVRGVGSMDDLRFMQRGEDTLIKVNAGNGFKLLARLEDVQAETLTDRHVMF